MRRWEHVALAIALCITAALAGACESSDTTDGSSAERNDFLMAVASDPAVFHVDYSDIADDDLVAAGRDVCTNLGKVTGTPDGLDFDDATERLVAAFDLQRAKPTPGAEQDPGVPLRNADLRLASAIGAAALEHLCPDQALTGAR